MSNEARAFVVMAALIFAAYLLFLVVRAYVGHDQGPPALP